jgi:steroid delta-isomerase-like uncharacterized protein
LGHVVSFLGRFAFLFATGIITLVFFRPPPGFAIPIGRYLLTLLAVFSIYCYMLALDRLGKELQRSDRRTLPVRELATRYTAAWCSQDAASVAAFFAEDGSLTINGGAPHVGRAAITAAAQGFMSAFPDMVVTMDGVRSDGASAVYRWTLTGTNTGPGGTGRAVRIRGYEEWTLGADGRIVASRGHFDEADYRRQLESR